ncbi:MAG TPA: DMT family transporter [Paracoccaceae bacterium]|nr:DMT family transporter [Paracoccaceae bacterium]
MTGGEGAKPWLGLVAAAVAVTIWAGWISATRLAMVEAVDPLVLAFCRNAVPPLVLLPVILRRGIVPRGASVPAVALMALGWGVPFVLMCSMGLQTVPASLFAPLTPGVAPILVALISAGLMGERLRGEVIAGLVLVALSLALILGDWVLEAELEALSGAPWLLAASLGFAIYTVNYRRSGLTPVEATAYVGLWSLPLVLPLWLARPEAFAGVGAADWALHIVVQGLLAGIVAAVAYALAIRHLGTVRGSMANALMPVAAGLAGIWLLGERLGATEWAAILLASLGVATANGVFRRRWRRAAE